MKVILIILISINLLFISCVSQKSSQTNSNIFNLDSLLKPKLKNLSISGRLSFTSAGSSASSNYRLFLENRDSMSFTATGPLGVSVGKAWISRTALTFYNTLENKAYVINFDDNNLLQPFDVSIDAVFALIRGEIPAGNFELSKKTDEFSEYRLKKTDYVELAKISFPEGVISRYGRIDISGKTIIDATLEDYYLIDNFLLPRKIKINIPKLETKLELSLDNISVNTEKTKPIYFKIPNGVEIITN